uniref:MFS transporter n=2 Tax=Acidianus brierleyi TaxID=41673 RepID=A0A2U9ICI2_9CREN
MIMDEVRKLIIFKFLLIVAENSLGYFFLWHLLGIIGLVLTYTLFSITNYIFPHIQLFESPLIDKYKDIVKLLKIGYVLDIITIISLYPIFLYLVKLKLLFFTVLLIGIPFSSIIKALESTALDKLFKILMTDYQRGIYLVRKYEIVALATGQILGTLLLALSLFKNLTLIVIITLIGLAFLLSVRRVDNEVAQQSYISTFKVGFLNIIKNNVLKTILIFNIIYSLPGSLINLFIVYLVYYALHLPPVFIGLWSIIFIIGSLVGNKLGYKFSINSKAWMTFLFVLSDVSDISLVFFTNEQLLPIIYVILFLSSIAGSFANYYFSYLMYSSIPEETFATSSSIMGSISSVFDAVFTIISSLIISLISYFWSVLIAVIIFVVLDILLVSSIFKLKKIDH